MANANCKVTAGVNWESIERYGRWNCYGGYGVFVTSGTTVTVYIPTDVVAISEMSATPVFSAAAAAANGQLTITGVTVGADGTKTPTTAGQVTVARVAGTDSALGFDFTMKYR